MPVSPSEIIHTSACRITPSAVNDLQCALKFKTLRIDRIWKKRDAILPAAHGKAVHLVLQNVYANRVGGTVDLSNLEALSRGAVRNTWYPKDIDMETQVRRVMAASRAFVDADDEEDIAGILDLERGGQFEVKMEGQVLCVISATLDCLLVRASRPDTLVLREWKTTAQRIDLKECFIQFWIAHKMYPAYKQIVIEFDWLDEEDRRITRDTVTLREIKGQRQIILGMAYKVLTATEFPASPGSVCCYCPRREECQSLPAEDIRENQFRRMADQLGAAGSPMAMA